MNSSSEAPKRNSLATGVLLMTAATYVTYAVGLLSNFIIARGLTPADYGRYVFAVFLSGSLVLIINNGLTTSAIRFVAELLGAGSVRGARRTHGYLLRLCRYSESLVIGLFGLAVVLIRPREWRSDTAVFAGVIAISAVAKARYLFNTSVAKGYSQFKIEAYCTVSVSVLTFVLIALAFWMHAQLLAYLALFGISSVAYLLMATVQLRRVGVASETGVRPEPEVLLRLHTHLRWTALLAAVAVLGNKGAEVLVLNATAGPSMVAFFAIGAALTRGGIDLLTVGLMTVLMPVMADAFGRGGEVEVKRIFANSLRYFGFAGILAAGVGYFLAAPTVQLLYGSKYLAAIPAFQVMVIISGLTLGESAFASLLTTTDRQRNRAMLVIAQISITVVMALALIPRFGLGGAIVAHAVSRLLGYSLMFGWVTRYYSARPPVGRLLLLLGCAAAAGALAWAVATLLPGIAGCVIAAFLYGCLLLPLSLVARCWTAEDFEFLSASLQRRAPLALRSQRMVSNLRLRFAGRVADAG